MPIIFYIDLFSGAGGTTTGVHLAGSEVVACVNHDTKAIESHKANHPNCLHLIEDIRDYKVIKVLRKLVEKLRRENPGCIIILWASLECTHFSKAKGGGSRKQDSRTLAYTLNNYIDELDPDYIQLENVREFENWGPIKIKSIPSLSNKHQTALKINAKGEYVYEEWLERKKEYYTPWIDSIKGMGYEYDHRLLNAADYGACQSRLRFFGIFAKPGLPIAWPKPTHAKNPDKAGTLFEQPLKPWKAVKNVLNLEDKGLSIFNLKKEPAGPTLDRIMQGLEAFVVPKTDYLIAYYGNSKKAHTLDRPIGTITTKDRYSLIQPQFMDNQYGNGQATSLDKHCGTITTNPKQQLVSAEFLFNPQFSSKGKSIDEPCFTLIARMDKRPPSLCSAELGPNPIKIKRSDSKKMKQLKQYCIDNGISDIKKRMLFIPELLQIQGFPSDYVLYGTQADQKKFIGNAVEVNQSRAFALATQEAIKEYFKKLAA